MIRRNGFTLVEVLATLVLLGIVMPVAMRGVSTALSAASGARRLTEVAGLAEAKLDEVVTDGSWASNSSTGDFSPDHPDYQWSVQSAQRSNGLSEVSVTVSWRDRSVERQKTISTLVYEGATGP